MSSQGKGNPRCEKCEGRGVIRAPHGYVVCPCVRGTAQGRAASARLNSAGTDPQAVARNWRKLRGEDT